MIGHELFLVPEPRQRGGIDVDVWHCRSCGHAVAVWADTGRLQHETINVGDPDADHTGILYLRAEQRLYGYARVPPETAFVLMVESLRAGF